MRFVKENYVYVPNRALVIAGFWTFELRDAHGRLKDRWQLPNKIVDVGRQWIVDLLQGLVSTNMEYLAIGTGTTQPSATDTALAAEVGTRIQGTRTEGASATVYRVTGTFGTNNPSTDATIAEAGIFDGPSGSSPPAIMLARVVDANPRFKATTDTLTVTVDVPLTAL